jgi:electron transfer flavoprotein beta subunit
VPSGLAEWLGIAQLTLLTEIDADTELGLARGRREIKGGYEILEVPLPCVVSVKSAANEPRFMDYRIKDWAFEPQAAGRPGRVTIWSAGDLDADPQCIGLNGSPTWVSALAQAPSTANTFRGPPADCSPAGQVDPG